MCIRLINKKPSTNLTSPSITVAASGTVVLLENGEHDVREYATAKVEVKQPEGTIEITENGTHNIADYAEANVNVVPDDVVDYWSTEPSSYPTYSFKFNYYMKEIPPFLDFSNLTKLDRIFELYQGEEADISKYNIGDVTSLYGMFQDCVNLKRAILKGHKFNSVTTIGFMFSGCKKLEYIDMRDFEYHDGINVYNTFKNVPTNCLIIVKDEAMRNLLLTSSKYLTNIKTVAEIEGV